MDELLKKCIEGNRDALDHLVEEYSRPVTAAVYQTLNQYSFSFGRDDVEDLHNGLFLALIEDDCKKIRQFKGLSSFKSYVRVLTVRYVIDFLRRQKKHLSMDSHPVPIDPADSRATADKIVELSQEEEKVRKIIKDLTTDEQLLLKLSFYQELPVNEIAKILNITVVAFYNKKSRLMKKIKKICEKSVG